MAFCSNCGEKLNEGARFCHNCGASTNDETSQRTQEYGGKIIKCPSCGEMLDSFVSICPACHYELRGTQTTSHVHKLSQMLEKAETDEQKNDLISNFYIPNTKEDIYEFFILAYSNITASGNCIDAWPVKLEQAYLKARLAFGDSKEFTQIEELYEKINKVSKRSKFANSKYFKSVILMGIGLPTTIISLIAAEILQEFDIYMYDALIPIALIGFICFMVGLILLVVPRKRKSRNNRK